MRGLGWADYVDMRTIGRMRSVSMHLPGAVGAELADLHTEVAPMRAENARLLDLTSRQARPPGPGRTVLPGGHAALYLVARRLGSGGQRGEEAR